MNVYICSTGYHLFQASKYANKNNHNILVVVGNRPLFVDFVISIQPKLKAVFQSTHFLHFINPPEILSMRDYLLKLHFLFKSLVEINSFLKLNNFKLVDKIVFFNSNHFELLFINKFKRRYKNLEIEYWEDGIGSYFLRNHNVIRKDSNNRFVSKFKLSLLNFKDISNFRFHFPDLLDTELIMKIGEDKILKFDSLNNDLKEFKIAQKGKFYFFQETKDEFNSIYDLLKDVEYHVKRHPATIEEKNPEKITQLDFIPWEFYMEENLVTNSVFLANFSTVIYTHLVFFSNNNNISILVRDLIHDNKLSEDPFIRRFLNRLLAKFPQKIYICDSLCELNELISSFSASL